MNMEVIPCDVYRGYKTATTLVASQTLTKVVILGHFGTCIYTTICNG